MRKDFPFGAVIPWPESFREINFRRAHPPVGQTHTIAGKASKGAGFELAASCGKVQRGPAKASNHTLGFAATATSPPPLG